VKRASETQSGITRRAVAGLLLGFVSCIAANGAAQPLQISRITPAGDDVPGGRQIVFQFDRAVVPIGRMDRKREEIPIAVSPQPGCEWRWLNTSALACQLGAANGLALATRYSVTVSPGFEAADGARLESTVTHTFTTARPQATYTRFVNWLSPGTPLIRVTFNQAVTRASVERALAFTTNAGSVALVAYPDDVLRRAPRWAYAAHPPPAEEPAFAADADPAPRRAWVVEPVRELPLDATVALDIGPGLVAAAGPERGIERRTVVAFDTYPAFRFLGLRCTPKGSPQARNLLLGELQAEDGPAPRCAPLKSVALLFSAPVLNSVIRDHATFAPALNGDRKDFDPWQNRHDWTELDAPHRRERIYERRLPVNLLADRRYRVALDENAFTDEFGRTLPAGIEFTLHTSHREPKLALGLANAVLEQGVDSDVPLYVTNLDHIDVHYDRLGSAMTGTGLRERLNVSPATDIAYARPLDVRRLLGQASGAVFARLRPHPLPPNWHRDPQILAQVTSYQVHYKLGHFNSLAWVTTFATGEPVAGANVSLWTGSADKLASLQPLAVSARTDADGIAHLPGLATIDPELELISGRHNVRLFAQVERDGETALLPIDYDYAVRGGGVYSHSRKRGGHTRAWGTTAQGVYKLGDVVDYKIYVRDQSNRHWVAPAPGVYVLRVTDPQGKTVFKRDDIALSRFGALDGRFTVPASGAVGWYRFHLRPVAQTADRSSGFSWQAMSVFVSDFAPSPFKVSAELNGTDFAAGDRVRISALANLHAGGPFTHAEVRLTARLEARPFTPDTPLADGFVFGSDTGGARTFAHTRDTLNDHGQAELQLDLPESELYFGALLVEAAVRDDRGKFVAATARADYAGRDHFVGLKQTQWLYTAGKPATLAALVVDRRGRARANAPVAIVVYRREVKTARVKGPGNAYLMQNVMTWVAQSACQLKTTEAAANCEFVPERAGYYQFIATTLDSAGREHHTTLDGWVTGSEHVVWDQSNDATLPIIAEKSTHAVGETARFLLKNPYPGAQALVTVERYGVIDSWTTNLATSTPVIEVPIKADYLPGFYLSVVVVSPRVAAPPEPGRVDLGKPGYRIGYLAVDVNDPAGRLAIDVTMAAKTVKPRERMRATIRLRRAPGDDTPTEFAVAVVDEAVLALNHDGAGYYDPYRGFNRLDSLDVNNYSLLARLIGRQKFEKKGANPGGGGGTDGTALRNLFKFVSYWNPSLEPGPDGTAEIEFEVPDNLTGWRILVLGVTPDARMGLGEANFKVNRPTEIRPVMPNQLRTGDRIKAGFTLMNRTAKPREITVSVDVDGPLADSAATRSSRALTVAPYARVPFSVPLTTVGDGDLRFVARATDAHDSDAIEHVVPVRRIRATTTAASYGTTVAANTTEQFAIPAAIYPDVGRIEAVLSPSVIGNIDGTFNYLKDYPHLCWEQRLTKAVAASAYQQLRTHLADTVVWPDPEADVVRTLGTAANFQAPNGGMAYWQASNEHVSPYLSAYTAIAFNWLRRDGRAVPAIVAAQLREYLLQLLRRDAFPSFYSAGMAASVRAVALAALAGEGAINAQDIARYERHVDAMDLFGKAHYLRAALATPNVAQRVREETLTKILAHADQSGGKFGFSETLDDGYAHLLATPLRANCAILSGLVDAATRAGVMPGIDQIPFKLVRAITQSRGRRTHFENTQENVFCLNALVDYANRFETERPDMRIAITLDNEPLGRTSFRAFTDPAVTLGRALNGSDPGRRATMSIAKDGPGRLYYAARIAYDLKRDNAERINAGIEIRRGYAVERNGRWQRLTSPLRIARGEIVRVDVFVSVPGARHFVVVDDPVPGGLEPVNADLATTSLVDAAKADHGFAAGSWYFTRDSWIDYGAYFASFYHKELRFDAARFYADYLPPGNYHLSYTAQAIAVGEFAAPSVRAEEMYHPDVYGRGLPATLVVED
jgi:uncharacterized protein YfaS (alpha-2-macroglobulin family)